MIKINNLFFIQFEAVTYIKKWFEHKLVVSDLFQ